MEQHYSAHLLILAFLGRIQRCAFYDAPFWNPGENPMVAVRQCSKVLQSLVIGRRSGGNGYVQIPKKDLREELNDHRLRIMGIPTYRTPAATRNAGGISREYIYQEQQIPDLIFRLTWKVDLEKIYVRGHFMGESHELVSYLLNTEVAQRLIDIFSDRRSYQILFAKKMSYLEEKLEKKKKEKLWDPKKDKAPAFSMTELKRDLANKVDTLNQKIIEIVSEHLYLEGIPEGGAWAYKFNTKGEVKVGVGSHLKIEKESECLLSQLC